MALIDYIRNIDKIIEATMSDRWLSVEDTAEYLGIARHTVYKWVGRLGLPSHKIGRLLKFSKSEIDDWVRGHVLKMTKAKTSERLLQLLRRSSPEIRKFGVKRIGLFGSCVRGEAGRGSDIDVLVEFNLPSFDNYMELKFFLEHLFDHEVDLVLAESVKEQIKPAVMGEVVYAEGF